jgi:hypothetical protein
VTNLSLNLRVHVASSPHGASPDEGRGLVLSRQRPGWRPILAPIAVVGVGVLFVAAVGPLLLTLVAGTVIAVVGGRRLYRTHATELVLIAWTMVVAMQTVSSYFGSLSDLIKMVDEPLTVLLVVWTLLERPRAASRWLVLVPAAGLLAAGLASNVLQATPVPPALIGGWSGVKFWTLLFITTSLPWRRRDLVMVSRWIAVVVTAVLAVSVLEFLAPSLHQSLFPVLNPKTEVRGGRVGLQAVFTHPGHFGSFALVFGSYYLARFVSSGNRRHLALGVACFTLGSLSLRLKIVLGLLATLGVLSLSATRKFVRRLGALVLVAVIAVASTGGMLTDVASDQIDRYFFSDRESVRADLYSVGGQIAIDNFPFGAGFGRYGSGASTRYDSPIYEEYGMTRGGLSGDNLDARHDTTWPTVVGEAGVIGLAFFFGGVLLIALRLFAFSRSPDPVLSEYSLAALAVVVALIVESTAHPSFFYPTTALSIALVVAAPLELGMRRRARSSPLHARPDRNSLRTPEGVGA